jgi:hypothetical protein
MLIFLKFRMEKWVLVTSIKALQPTSAEVGVEGDSGTFSCSHGKKINSAEQQERDTVNARTFLR